MAQQVKGLKDIYAILSNERKLGGVIETTFIRLQSGEEYPDAVITNVDVMGSVFYSISFVTNNGTHMIVNVSQVAMISAPLHKKTVELNNVAYKKMKTDEKLKYLIRLFEVNEGSKNPFFLEEAKLLIQDIGLEAARQKVDVSYVHESKKLYSIA